jgi:signal transduction histidine kinase
MDSYDDLLRPRRSAADPAREAPAGVFPDALRALASRDIPAELQAALEVPEPVALQRPRELHRRQLAAMLAGFAAAETPAQAAEALLLAGAEALGASSAAVVGLAPPGRLELVLHRGLPADVVERYRSLALEAPLPAAEVVRSGQPTWIGGPEELRARYPELEPVRAATGDASFAAVPLAAGGEVWGALVLGFPGPLAAHLEGGGRELVLAVGRACAQGLRSEDARRRSRAALERAEAAEVEARRIAELQQALMAAVGHDLRTPLAVVSMGAKLLLQRGGLDDRQARTVAQISASASRMEAMIRDLLDVSRARMGGGIPVTPAAARIESICSAAIQELRETWPERSIALSLQGTGAGWWDASRLVQVVSNLVSNALEHGHPESEVRVRATSDGKELRLEVQNDGAPIAPELLPEVFEPFRRGGAAPRGGLGLGLFIVREIVRAHGGEVSVESDAARGTTFTVRLPMFAGRGGAGGGGGRERARSAGDR